MSEFTIEQRAALQILDHAIEDQAQQRHHESATILTHLRREVQLEAFVTGERNDN
jgi:hypothetical protein